MVRVSGKRPGRHTTRLDRICYGDRRRFVYHSDQHRALLLYYVVVWAYINPPEARRVERCAVRRQADDASPAEHTDPGYLAVPCSTGLFPMGSNNRGPICATSRDGKVSGTGC